MLQGHRLRFPHGIETPGFPQGRICGDRAALAIITVTKDLGSKLNTTFTSVSSALK